MIYGYMVTKEPLVHGRIPAFNEVHRTGDPVRFNRINITWPAKVNGKVKFEFARTPVVSSNSQRGQARRRFIAKTLQVLETPKNSLSPALLHLLAAGGNTPKGQAAPSNQHVYKTEMRENMPFVKLLGGATCGMFLKGMLKVGFAYPVAQQTFWMLEGTPLKDVAVNYGSNLTSVNEIDEKIFVMRMCKHSIGDELLVYSAGDIAEELEELEEVEVDADATEDSDSAPKKKSGAIFSAEALPPGVHLFTTYDLRYRGDELLESAMNAFVECFLELSTLGGYVAKGCGRVDAEFFYSDGSKFDPANAQKYWEYLRKNKNAINNYMIKSFPKIIKASDDATAKKKEQQKEKGKGNGKENGKNKVEG